MLSSDEVRCVNNGLSEIKLSSNQRIFYSGIHLTLSCEVMQPSRSVYSSAWSSEGFFLCRANSRFLQRITKYFFQLSKVHSGEIILSTRKITFSTKSEQENVNFHNLVMDWHQLQTSTGKGKYFTRPLGLSLFATWKFTGLFVTSKALLYENFVKESRKVTNYFYGFVKKSAYLQNFPSRTIFRTCIILPPESLWRWTERFQTSLHLCILLKSDYLLWDVTVPWYIHKIYFLIRTV